MKTIIFLVFISVAHFTSATTITVQNHLSNTVSVGGFQSFDLAPGASRSYGLGAGASGRVFGHTGDSGNPTLAEFSINSWDGMDFYDLSVIDGFNLPMKIIPANGGCPTVTCTSANCPDAYHYPTDDTKTHGCATTDYIVAFTY